MLQITNRQVLKFIRNHRAKLAIAAVVILVVLIILTTFSIAPGDFPSGTIISIPKGTTVSEAAQLLAENNIIKHPLFYTAYVILLHDGKGIRAGEYLFNDPESALRVAYRTAYGIEDLTKIKVTVPEGLASSDIARLLVKNIPNFDGKRFLSLAKPKEGYLFPDTYFFYQSTTPEQVVGEMRQTFDQKTAGLVIPALLSGRSWSDIVKMASLVGEEATSSADRRIIAGILWKRLADNYPLQVDTPFFYILGKTSAELTVDDLATTSPYNLYKHKGLPPTPIDNPGLDAITDTMNPTETKYWFYLSDIHGNLHYAATHEEHVVNRDKYLN